MLQTAGRDSEFERVAMRRQLLKSVNQPSSEAVSTAHSVHDVSDVVVAADEKFFAVVQTSRPSVMRSALRFPQGNCDGFQVGIELQNLGG